MEKYFSGSAFVSFNTEKEKELENWVKNLQKRYQNKKRLYYYYLINTKNGWIIKLYNKKNNRI